MLSSVLLVGKENFNLIYKTDLVLVYDSIEI